LRQAMKTLGLVLCVSVLQTVVGAQVANRTEATTTATPQPMVSDISPILGQLQQTAQALNASVSRLRIDKWKADSAVRQQAQHNADSISRNLTSALPGVIDQVRANPQGLAPAFKLYRNVIALYDVYSSLTESAGAFGPKGDYEAMANEGNNLDDIRRALGDKLENMAALKDTEITRLRTQVAQAAAAVAPPPPPKKIVIDDTETPKKAKTRKKPATKPADQGTTPQ
jgi:hypothetical protein